MWAPRKVSETHPGSLSLSLPQPHASAELLKSSVGSREKGPRTDRLREAQRGQSRSQVKTTLANGGSFIRSLPPPPRPACQAQGRQAPAQSTRSGRHFMPGHSRQPTTGTAPPHGSGEVLPGAGHKPRPWKEMGTAGEEGEWRTKGTFRPSSAYGLLIPSRQGVGGGQSNRFGVWGGRDSVWAPEEAAMTSKGHF